MLFSTVDFYRRIPSMCRAELIICVRYSLKSEYEVRMRNTVPIIRN